ncbi:DNA-binding transcriptional LysR family regulator [Sinorhizobium kostiense]|uniref:DNA-binding transcriptional LysR family regulator n=1 Tax=Sinorhizobium kostiense TaxID=76747 RepID=A0ABS4QT48_9HYPH|nr:LysR family transcriptional regulator [Sinorhizobium kostiense]MBP2233813.1 DNA-binding transcriptional LysR family regulator [Sinorhizobium kostiense]
MGDLSDIRVFLAVAQQRSFTAAARQLSMTPPTVTRAVSALEESLGVQLLLRTTRQVSLTSAGAVYAARVEPLIRQFDQVREDLREEQGEVAGLIRLNAPLSLGQQILPDIVSGFRAEYPRVSISLSLTDRFIDIVSESFDLALRVSEPPRDKSTIWRKVCRVRRILVASPGYLAAFGTPETPDDLHRHAGIAYDEEAIAESWELMNGGRTRKISAGKLLAANNGELIARLAEDGQGVALLPHFIVDEALSRGTLKQVLAEWEPPELWLTLYYPPYEKLPMRVARFSDFFETYVTQTRPL